MLRNKKVYAALFLLNLFSFAEAASVIRCAFDIGSGETKVAVARIENKQVDVLFRKDTRVPIRKSVRDGVLPEAVAKDLSRVLGNFKAECEKRGATEFVGVATSGFRAASVNGKELLAQIALERGMNLKVISGDEEAILGYKAVANNISNEVKNKKLIVWDIGGGSMQFAIDMNRDSNVNYLVQSLNVGVSSFKQLLHQELNRISIPFLEPLAENEVQVALGIASNYANSVSPELKELIKGQDVLIAGIGSPQVEAIALALGKFEYTLDEVIQLRQSMIDKSLDYIKTRFPLNTLPENQMSNLILISGMMNELKIKKIRVFRLNLTDGLFTLD
ncbi:MAG: Ppx/GppA phosphatase family protein [Bacteriovoracaceae bacterium]